MEKLDCGNCARMLDKRLGAVVCGIVAAQAIPGVNKVGFSTLEDDRPPQRIITDLMGELGVRQIVERLCKPIEELAICE